MLEQWPQALDLNYEVLQSQKARDALAFFIARTHFNAYGPLLRLRRYPEARHLLLECRNVFERENSIEMLGKVLSALADVEDTLGGPATARQFEVAALRYKYIELDPRSIAISHFNLANYLTRGKPEWRESLGASPHRGSDQCRDGGGERRQLSRRARAGPAGGRQRRSRGLAGRFRRAVHHRGVQSRASGFAN